MKKIFALLVILMVVFNRIFAWEINTHRAIDRKAAKSSVNLKRFAKNAQIENVDYGSEKFEGYTKYWHREYSYLDYVTNGEENGISDKRWKQTFTDSKYQSLIEAGAILEDAQWPHPPGTSDTIDKADGRFVNHFYDPQNGGKGLFYLGFRFQNAYLWGKTGEGKYPDFLTPTVQLSFESFVLSDKDNDYDYNLALEYFNLAFTSANPSERKRYQAKMLVSVGHLMHLLNDMTSTAHTRDDSHPEGDVLEMYGRGGEEGNIPIGFRIVGSSLRDYLGLTIRGKISLPNIPKYDNFSDFITKEAMWTATHFFSNDTVYTKPKPSLGDTYESFASSGSGVDKYYIRSYGNGTSGCRNGCVPSGTKLAIRLKSYILNALHENIIPAQKKNWYSTQAPRFETTTPSSKKTPASSSPEPSPMPAIF